MTTETMTAPETAETVKRRRDTITITTRQDGGKITSLEIKAFDRTDNFDFGSLPVAIVNDLIVYGLKQKLADSIAQNKGADREKSDAVFEVFTNLQNGIWSRRGTASAAGGKVTDREWLQTALERKYAHSKTAEQLAAFVAKKEDADVTKLLKSPEIKVIVATLKAEKSGKGGDDLLSELDE